MIFLGPQETEDAEPLAQLLELSEVLVRSATEMETIRDAVADLEWMIVSNPTLMQDPELRTVLQSIDPIQQSLQAMAGFTGAIAQETDHGAITVETALQAVHLESLRNRLGRIAD
ncbi:hypothetical protein ABMC88_16675 [Sulfitobacter sp. HNIBRBA2951]|uniref:hypothetical protein n=1 Tax=Sulfitobacter aquimarinus TaxID=3158557 RepID=UPI0032DE6BFB